MCKSIYARADINVSDAVTAVKRGIGSSWWWSTFFIAQVAHMAVAAHVVL